MTPDDRSRILWQHLRDRRGARRGARVLETLNNGKPIVAARRDDIPNVAAMFRYYAGWATKVQGKTIPTSAGNFLTYTRHEPIGVCAGIIPWNYPLMMAGWKIAPALACGNVIIMKPAEQTPLSLLRFAELAAEAGLPAGVAERAERHGRDDGRRARRAPGRRQGRVHRLGRGRAPDHEGLDRQPQARLARARRQVAERLLRRRARTTAIDGAVWGIYYNMGQDCTAGSRLFVQSGIYDEVIGGLVDGAQGDEGRPGHGRGDRHRPARHAASRWSACSATSTSAATEGQIPVGGGRAHDRRVRERQLRFSRR